MLKIFSIHTVTSNRENMRFSYEYQVLPYYSFYNTKILICALASKVSWLRGSVLFILLIEAVTFYVLYISGSEVWKILYLRRLDNRGIGRIFYSSHAEDNPPHSQRRFSKRFLLSDNQRICHNISDYAVCYSQSDLRTSSSGHIAHSAMHQNKC